MGENPQGMRSLLSVSSSQELASDFGELSDFIMCSEALHKAPLFPSEVWCLPKSGLKLFLQSLDWVIEQPSSWYPKRWFYFSTRPPQTRTSTLSLRPSNSQGWSHYSLVTFIFIFFI